MRFVILPAVAAGLGTFATPGVAQHPSDPATPFQALHVERQRDIVLEGPLNRVVSLFAPGGWERWMTAGHEREIIFPRSGPTRAGAVMLSRNPEHDNTTVWILADYAPEEGRLRYLNVIPDYEAWELEIRCAARGPGTTAATIIYRVTALSEPANRVVRAFFDTAFETTIDGWATAINRHLGANR